MQKNIPTTIVILGATGDLMSKKIAPALFHLFIAGHLPRLFQIIGFARRPFSDLEFRQLVRWMICDAMEQEPDPVVLEQFLIHVSYHRGEFTDTAAFQALAKILGRIDGTWSICSSKLFHIAVPPNMYERIITSLVSSGLTEPCGPDEGWTRVVVEKPFGRDATTAAVIDAALARQLKEEQIYRVDHYLGKEIVQNIVSFRFSNNLFEQSWHNEYVERIDVRILEKAGVDTRGDFYDGVGALRDVGQNHLLQMLALVTMDRPESFGPEAVRARRALLLEQLHVFSNDEVPRYTFRGQYNGYSSVPGVAAHSSTETYFKMSARLASPRWDGVPIILETGKHMHEQRKEITVTFRHPTPCLCPPGVREHYKNRVVFLLDPLEGIRVFVWLKRPGVDYTMEERSFDFLLHGPLANREHVDEYAKLLLDCIRGDQTLFVSTREVRAMWRFTDPIVSAWQEDITPLAHYAPGTDEAHVQSIAVETS